MIKTIIIDDEEKSRKLLENLLSEHCPELHVVATAGSVETGLQVIEKNPPDLVFLDIVMPFRNGFSLLEMLDEITFEIMFTTAYDQYAIKAIRFSALDYLLKPINIDELKNAVKKVLAKQSEKEEKDVNQRLEVFLENASVQASDRKLGIPTQYGIDFVHIKDIVMVQAEGNYSVIYLKNSRSKEIVSRTLKEFDDLLKEYNFFRIHRTWLINLSHVIKYSRTNQSAALDGDGGSVTMINSLQIPVSRDKRKYLINRISKPF
jgi:two-component system LytT family response regulator